MSRKHRQALPGATDPAPIGLRRGARAVGLAAALVAGLAPGRLQAGDLLRDCRRWTSASGVARIELGNQLGADHLLTKDTRLAQSPEGQPVALYRFGDLQRLCRDAS